MADASLPGTLQLVQFHDDTLLAVDLPAKGVYVAVRPICERLGLRWGSQLLRLKRDLILAEGVLTMALPLLGMSQEMVCLRLDLVHGWLFSIDVNRVLKEHQEAVRTYQRECYKVLHQHFHPDATRDEAGRLVQADPSKAQETDQAKLAMVKEARLIFGVAAAAQLWIVLGLQTVPKMLRLDAQHDLFDREVSE